MFLLIPLDDDLVVEPQVNVLKLLGIFRFDKIGPKCLKQDEFSRDVAASDENRDSGFTGEERDVAATFHVDFRNKMINARIDRLGRFQKVNRLEELVAG